MSFRLISRYRDEKHDFLSGVVNIHPLVVVEIRGMIIRRRSQECWGEVTV